MLPYKLGMLSASPWLVGMPWEWTFTLRFGCSWVLLRQRIAHLERQLSAARSEAERRRDVRSGHEALKCSMERCMSLQRDLDRCA